MNRRRLPPTLSACFALSALLCCSRPASSAWFVRGDLNSSGTLNVTDAVLLLRSLFLGGQDAARCQDAADVNDDGTLGLADAVHLLGDLFLQGPRPGPNDLFPGCWFDGTPDALDCAGFAPCNPVGVFFCCDKSGTMRGGTRFQRLKDLMIGVIAELSDADQLSVVFFDSAIMKFPATGMPGNATRETKESAGSFIASVQPGSGTCGKSGLFQSLNFANQSTARARTIIYLSDGFHTCPGSSSAQYARETLDEVTARNTQGVQINTVSIGLSTDESWMEDLASLNSGHHVWLGN